jgi:pimeloyl-ACP methyl ester carboxylesterase
LPDQRASERSLFRLDETPGPHAVGFRVIERYDRSRIFRPPVDALGAPIADERARPLQVLNWYPAKSVERSSMTVADYFSLWATETSFGTAVISARAKEWFEGMRASMKTQLRGVRDAREIKGAYPLVVYAPGFSCPAWENADLCEYLASHGYVVIASSSMGETTRAMTADIAGINAQARDISFLIGEATTFANVDPAKIAVIGFSWGGLSNLFAAARDDRIRALVAWDGSLRYFPGLVAEAGDVHPRRMTIPLLYIGQGNISLEEYERYGPASRRIGENVLNAWANGDLTTVYMWRLAHWQYSSAFVRNDEIWAHCHDTGATWDVVISDYAYMTRVTRRFLDAELKGNDRERTRDVSVSNAACASISLRRRNHKLASVRELRIAIAQSEPGSAQGILCEAHDLVRSLHEATLIEWAEELLDVERVAAAIAVLQANLEMHPASTGALIALGRAHQRAGDVNGARHRFEQALQIDPENHDAWKRLKALEGSA